LAQCQFKMTGWGIMLSIAW